jgi:hypothetical protein
MPVASNQNGFIVLNVKTKEVFPRIVTYDEAFNQDFDFYEENANETQLETILNMLNIPQEEIDKLNKDKLNEFIDEQIIKHDTVCIKLNE